MWDKVRPVERNGIITKYEVEYNHTAYSDTDSSNEIVETTDLMVVLDSLHEYTEYYIRVRAYTSAGAGPYSNETFALTHEESKKVHNIFNRYVNLMYYFRASSTAYEHYCY